MATATSATAVHTASASSHLLSLVVMVFSSRLNCYEFDFCGFAVVAYCHNLFVLVHFGSFFVNFAKDFVCLSTSYINAPKHECQYFFYLFYFL